MPSLNPSNARKLARPVLIIGVVTVTALGWLFTKPDSSSVLIPYPEAGIAIDALVDVAIDSPAVDAPAIDAFIPDAGINLDTPWVLHTIIAHALCQGADGTNVADFDGDGKMDITTACEQGNNAYVARGNGDGTFTTFTLPLPILSAPEDSRFGDVDGDGKLDVVVAESGGLKIRWYRNKDNGVIGTGRFDSPITVSTGTYRFMHAAVHSPGVIFAGSYSTGAEVGRFTASAPYTTWTHTTLTGAGWVKGLEIHGDDLLIWDYTGSLRGVRWVTTATGTPGTTRLTTDVNTLRGAKVGSQIVTAVGSSDGLSPGLSVSVVGGVTATFPSFFGRAQAVTLCDVDMDGTDDMVLTASHSNDPNTSTHEPPSALSSVVWLKGPAFTQRGEISGTLGIKHDNIVCVDVDGDGDLDGITTEEKSLGLIWYENPLYAPVAP